MATLEKNRNVTGRARAQLAADLKARYEQGATLRALRDYTGRSYGFVHRLLTEQGVVLRSRGGNTRGGRR